MKHIFEKSVDLAGAIEIPDCISAEEKERHPPN